VTDRSAIVAKLRNRLDCLVVDRQDPYTGY